MARVRREHNPRGGAEWEYLAANVEAQGRRLRRPRRDLDQGRSNGVEVGFVGAVTEDLPALVSPGGIAEIEVTDIVDGDQRRGRRPQGRAAPTSSSCWSTRVRPTPTAPTMDDDPTSDFGNIVTGRQRRRRRDRLRPHPPGLQLLASRCAGWATARAVTERPVVSAGQYGTNLNQLVFTVDPTTGDAAGQDAGRSVAAPAGQSRQLPVRPGDGPGDRRRPRSTRPTVLGAGALGQIDGPFNRAQAAPTAPPRTVAASRPWATWSPRSSAGPPADAGVRQARDRVHEPGRPARRHDRRRHRRLPAHADLPSGRQRPAVRQHAGEHGPDRRADRGRARAAVAAHGRRVPSRPFLRLGVVGGLHLHLRPRRPAGSPAGTKGEVTGMWLDGEPIRPGDDVLGDGQLVPVDRWRQLPGASPTGRSKRDTGKVDLRGDGRLHGRVRQPGRGRRPLPVDYASVRSGSPSRPVRRRRTSPATR